MHANYMRPLDPRDTTERSLMRVRSLAVLLVALQAWTSPSWPKPFVHAIPADIASLDPADIRGQQDQEIGVNVYERLVQFKFEPQKDGTLQGGPERNRAATGAELDRRRPGHHLQAAPRRHILSVGQ